MAAATNDLNKIINEKIAQLPECMKLIDSVISIIDNVGKYDVKKVKSNVKNFKKMTVVVEDCLEVVNTMASKLCATNDNKSKLAGLAQIMANNNPIQPGDKDKGGLIKPKETGFKLIDEAANVFFTIQKVMDCILDATTGEKSKLLKSSRKLRRTKKNLIKAIKVVFDILEEIRENLNTSRLSNKSNMKKFKELNEFIKFFDVLYGVIKKLLKLQVLAILVVATAPIILLSFSILTIVLNGIFLILSLIKPRKIRRAYRGIFTLSLLFKKLGLVLLELLILALVMPIAIKAAIMVALGLIKLSLLIITIFTILWLLTKIIRIFKIRKSILLIVLTLYILMILMAVVLVMAVLMLGISKVARYIEWVPIIIFFLAVAALILLFKYIGKVATKALPIISYSVYAIVIIVAAITIIVALMLFMALMLCALQYVKLDSEKISDNVKKVVETALLVIASIFQPKKEKDDAKGKPWYKKLLLALCDGIQFIIEAIMAVTFLALSFVAITLILLMATELRLLQTINLDAPKISDNVRMVVDTAMMIVNQILYRNDKRPEDDSGKPWYKKFLEFMGSSLFQIIEVIMAVIFLALSCIAITLVLLIAGELRLLQTINLDTASISENVMKVIDTAMMVVNQILYRNDKRPEDDKGKSWYKKLFEFIGGTLFQIIEVIIAVIFLALSCVAISLVLLIAGELALLQMISLNPDAINSNVTMVINTAQMVVDTIFKKDDKEEDPSKKGFFRKVIEVLGIDKVLMIIDAIMAVAYLATIVVAILLITFIAKTLEYIQGINLNQDLITTNIMMVISTAQMVVKAVFDPTDDKNEDPSKKGFFRTILSWIGLDKMLDILEAIMAMAYLALVLVSICLVKYIADTLVYVQTLNLDEGKIKNNVKKVISCAQTVVAAVTQRDDSSRNNTDGVIKTILKFFLPDSWVDFIDAICALGYVAVVKASVGLVADMAKDLTAIANLPSMEGISDKVKKITNTSKKVIDVIFNGDMSEDEITMLCVKAEAAEEYFEALAELPELLAEIVEGYMGIPNADMTAKTNSVIGFINSLTDTMTKFEDLGSNTTKYLNVTGLILGVLNEIVDKTNSISLDKRKTNTIIKLLNGFVYFWRSTSRLDLKHGTIDAMKKGLDLITSFSMHVLRNRSAFKESTNMVGKLLRIYGGFFKTMNRLDVDERKEITIQNIFKSLTEFNQGVSDEKVNKSAALLRNYDSFLTKINTVRIENLDTAARVFEEMARFSESISGNFDALAQALNEEIAPILEELRDTMKDTADFIQKENEKAEARRKKAEAEAAAEAAEAAKEGGEIVEGEIVEGEDTEAGFMGSAKAMAKEWAKDPKYRDMSGDKIARLQKEDKDDDHDISDVYDKLQAILNFLEHGTIKTK